MGVYHTFEYHEPFLCGNLYNHKETRRNLADKQTLYLALFYDGN